MKNYYTKLNRVNTGLKLVLASAILFSNCTTDNEIIDLSAPLNVNNSFKSVELPIYGITSDTKQHKDSSIDLAIDDDENSKWLAYGSEINVDIDLGGIHKVDYINISFYEGDDKAFKFKIFSLIDGA